MKSRYFSIHGILNFIVFDETNFKIMDTFYSHYENFEIKNKPKKIHLIFNLGNFKPDIDEKYEVGYGKYYVDENYFYVKKESYKGANWSFEIKGVNEEFTEVNIAFNHSGRMFITGNVIDFIIHLKLLNRSCPIIHASAISKDNGGIVFCGRGGSGKTSIAFEFLNNGFDFLADNYIILNDGGIFNFPTSLSLFTYNMNDLVFDRLKLMEKFSIKLKNLLYKLSGEYAKFFTKVNPKRILNKLVHSSRLNIVFIIQPIENKRSIFSIKELKRETAIKKVLYNQMMEFTFFNQYIDIYSFFYPDYQLSKHWELYKNSVNENLPQDIKFYEISTSSDFNGEIVNKIKNFIEGYHV